MSTPQPPPAPGDPPAATSGSPAPAPGSTATGRTARRRPPGALLAVLAGIVLLGATASIIAVTRSGGDATLGIGIPVVIIGALVTLGGSIAALAKRRR